jgi:hypothetical protein
MRDQFKRVLTRAAVVLIFSVAMAWVESATVAYLRTLVNRVEPYQLTPLPIAHSFGAAEIIREAATLAMLASVGWLAGSSTRSRLGFFMISFAIWDIFYYLFLKIIVGWPHTIFDWDVLFLIPLPWWGPVLSPILISLDLIMIGALFLRSDFRDEKIEAGGISWALHVCGIILALYVFLEHSIQALLQGGKALTEELPIHFNWGIFILSLWLMVMPVLEEGIRSIRRKLPAQRTALH